MNQMNFIKTLSETTASELRNLGFQELPKEDEFFVFINNDKLFFSDEKNIIRTNKLNL